MFGFIAKSKPTTAFLSAAILASAMLATPGLAAPFSAGNSSEIPIVPHDMVAGPNNVAPEKLWGGNADEIPLSRGSMAQAYDGAPQTLWGGNADEIPLIRPGTTSIPKHAAMTARASRTTSAPAVAANSSSNSAATCVNGHRWEETAANGWTLPMPCHS